MQSKQKSGVLTPVQSKEPDRGTTTGADGSSGEKSISGNPREVAIRRCLDAFPRVTTLEQALTVGATLAMLEGEAEFVELFLRRLVNAKELGVNEQSGR